MQTYFEETLILQSSHLLMFKDLENQKVNLLYGEPVSFYKNITIGENGHIRHSQRNVIWGDKAFYAVGMSKYIVPITHFIDGKIGSVEINPKDVIHADLYFKENDYLVKLKENNPEAPGIFINPLVTVQSTLSPDNKGPNDHLVLSKVMYVRNLFITTTLLGL